MMLFGCDGPASPAVTFKLIQLYPTFRCPKTDLFAQWITHPPTKIEIHVNGELWKTGPDQGSYKISADVIDDLALDEVEVKFVPITSQSREEPTFTIKTFFHNMQVIVSPAQVPTDTKKYTDELPDELWDDNIFVDEVSLIGPKEYECSFDDPRTKHHEWSVDKGMSGLLLKKEEFKATFNPEVQAQGEWIYKTNAACALSKPSYNSPQFTLNCFCK
jgi:hypothetical protein